MDEKANQPSAESEDGHGASPTSGRPPSPPRPATSSDGRRKWIAGLLGVSTLAVVFWFLREAPPQPPPNVVLIVLDTVRADSVGIEVADEPLTPHLDAVSREGTAFLAAVTPAPWTVPSHASLFTGTYPHQHRTQHGDMRLKRSARTMAEILRLRGYQTAGFTCNPWLSRVWGWSQGFQTYEQVYEQVEGLTEKGAAIATKMVADWIDEHADRGAPFFLFVNYLEAHLPYSPPARILDRLRVADAGSDRTFSIEQAVRYIAGRGQSTSVDMAHVRALYQAEIAYLDEQVGAVVSSLRAAGCLDNTILIITSDHGEHFGEHGLMGHEFSVSEALLRIPLTIRYPKVFDPGTTHAGPVSLVDILPTILSILSEAENQDAERFSGTCLLNAVGDAAVQDRPILAEYARPIKLINEFWRAKYPDVDMSAHDVSLKTLRKGRFKYVVSGRGEEALYDLATDPGERHDVAKHHPRKLAELRKELEQTAGLPTM